MTKEESTKIVNCMTPGAGVLVLGRGHTVNMQYFSPLLFYTRPWIIQIKYKAIMNKEGSAKIVNYYRGFGSYAKAWLYVSLQ